jgi:hypothetical protein
MLLGSSQHLCFLNGPDGVVTVATLARATAGYNKQ